MIFVTIGTQAPFDRLIKEVDRLAPSLNEEVVAQGLKSNLKPQNIRLIDFISPAEFSEYVAKSSLIISHAGMGTIISALMARKPLIIVPRKASLGEHRNEHQMATARRLQEMGYVTVAFETGELETKLHECRSQTAKGTIKDKASQSLIDSLTDFILKEKK